MTQTKLCGALFLSKQTVNSALKKLESRGYLRMESMSGDRRNKLLSLTDRGRSCCVWRWSLPWLWRSGPFCA